MTTLAGRVLVFAGLIGLRISAAAAAPSSDVRAPCEHCPRMTIVPAGRFDLGNSVGEGNPDEFVFADGRPDRVVFGHSFALGTDEVTVGQFRAFVRATGYETVAEKRGGCHALLPGGYSTLEPAWNWRNPGYPQGERHPVTCVAWTDATAYVTWLSHTTGQAYRLPSEAELEYVARAGRRLRYGANSDASEICSAGNVAGREVLAVMPGWRTVACTDRRTWPAPAETTDAAPWGVHALYGNLSEWTADCYAPRHGRFAVVQGQLKRQVHDGSARAEQCMAPLQRVVKGASWTSPADEARMGVRMPEVPTRRTNWIGFRVALSLESPAPLRPSALASPPPRPR